MSLDEAVIIEPYEEIELIIEPTIELVLGETVNLSAFVANKDINEISFEWFSNEPDALSCTLCDSPEYSGFRTNTVEVIATDLVGCSSTSQITIFVESNAELYVPNAFSPNGDGINDRLTVFGNSKQIASLDEFNIYDRWGNQITGIDNLILNDESNGWNGDFKEKSLNNGVFIWVLEVTFIDGETKIYSGEVSLIR